MYNLPNAVRRLLYKMSIKTKLLVVSFALILLPLSITCMIMFYNITNMIAESIFKVSGLSLDYTAQVLADRLATAQNIANAISSNLEVNRILSEDPKDYNFDDQLTDSKFLLALLSTQERDSRILRARLTVNDGLLYSNGDYHFINNKNREGYPWADSKVSGTAFLWTSDNGSGSQGYTGSVKAISCIKQIHNLNNYDNIIGAVSVDISESEIKAILSRADLTKEAFIFAVSSDKEVLAKTGSIADETKILKNLVSLENTDRVEINISGHEYQVQVKTLEGFGWNMISCMPMELLQKERNRMLVFTLVLMVTLTVVTFLLGYLLYKSSLKRIQNIVAAMKGAQDGKLDVRLLVHGEDEIGKIEQNYNHMITRIEELIEETLSLVQRARDAELKSLQAQINPHFLYNTINTISWTAMDYGAHKVCKMLKAMSDFYKLSIQKGMQEVSVEDEIRHVEAYIELQNMRYDNAIIFELDIPAALRKCRMLNMILQPLVENSILHGIMARSEKKGKIVLHGEIEGEDVVLTIEDDGVGIDAETLENMEAALPNHEDYGIYNINERLMIRFGAKYKLHFESRQGLGTRVEVRLPWGTGQ